MSGDSALIVRAFNQTSKDLMKLLKSLCSFSSVAVSLLATAGWLVAAPGEKPYQGSAEFEKMKSLVGTWKGNADMGQGSKDFTVEYRLISGGSALEERIFAGTPEEMVTMYYDRNGKLALTHYCMLANQPGMALASSDLKTMKFNFDPTCGVNSKKDMHMHSLALTFESPDTIVQNWQLFKDGKAQETHPFTLKRVRA
jgi:hypothetical protein